MGKPLVERAVIRDVLLHPICKQHIFPNELGNDIRKEIGVCLVIAFGDPDKIARGDFEPAHPLPKDIAAIFFIFDNSVRYARMREDCTRERETLVVEASSRKIISSGL